MMRIVEILFKDEGECYRCEYHASDGEAFGLKVGKDVTLLSNPSRYALIESMAYFHIFRITEHHDVVPDKTVAA